MERNAIQASQKESKKRIDPSITALKITDELEAEERLVEIARELQEAMRSRDTSFIRQLMAERGALTAKYRDRKPLALEKKDGQYLR